MTEIERVARAICKARPGLSCGTMCNSVLAVNKLEGTCPHAPFVLGIEAKAAIDAMEGWREIESVPHEGSFYLAVLYDGRWITGEAHWYKFKLWWTGECDCEEAPEDIETMYGGTADKPEIYRWQPLPQPPVKDE